MRRGAAAALLAALVALLVAPTAARAQPLGDRATASARLTVSSFTGVLGPGTVGQDATAPEDLHFRVLVENNGTVSLSDLRLVVEVFDDVARRGRSVLWQTLDRDTRLACQRCLAPDWPVREDRDVAPGDIAGVAGTIPGDDAPWKGRNGIFPVQISVVKGTETLDSVVTAVVHLADRPTHELSTTLVWPLDAPPWRNPDGSYPAGIDAAIRPGGRLAQLVGAAESHRDAGILLAPAPHLLEDLADRADGFDEVPSGDTTTTRHIGRDEPTARLAGRFLDRIRALTTSLPYPPLAAAYADDDIASLVDASSPLPALGGLAVTEGRRRLQALTGRQPDASAFLATTPLSRRALDLLPGDRVLLPYADIVGPPLSQNPDLPYPLRTLRSTSDRQLIATIADPRLASLLADPPTRGDPVLTVQRVVAETAMIYLEKPGTSGRPLLVLPPVDWQPQTAVPGALLDALTRLPWLHLTTPSTQAADSPATLEPADLARPDASMSDSLADTLAETTLDLDALRKSLPTSDARVAGRPPQTLLDELLRTPSQWFVRGDEGAARALVEDVEATVDRAYGRVEVPASARITLTSDTGSIPVTLQRPEGGPISVLVTVGGSGSLSWPKGQTQKVTLEGPGSRTVAFDTHASGPGTFPVTVRVTDLASRRVLEDTTMSVRSTAISRTALFIVGGAVALLLLVGFLRRRSPDRPKLEIVRR